MWRGIAFGRVCLFPPSTERHYVLSFIVVRPRRSRSAAAYSRQTFPWTIRRIWGSVHWQGYFWGRILTNGDFTTYVCDSAATRPSSQITLGKHVYMTFIFLYMYSLFKVLLAALFNCSSHIITYAYFSPSNFVRISVLVNYKQIYHYIINEL